MSVGQPNVEGGESLKRYRVAWKSKLTGATGHGECLSERDAKAWMEKANRENAELEHWLEPEQK
jgi:hypothetical protein